MEPRDPKPAALAQAIAYMTAVQENPDGPSELSDELFAEAVESDEGAATLLVGLQSLASYLLVLIEKDTGQSASDVLQRVARGIERPPRPEGGV